MLYNTYNLFIWVMNVYIMFVIYFLILAEVKIKSKHEMARRATLRRWNGSFV